MCDFEENTVRIRGLVKNSEHNGELGVILRYIESKERYLVQMKSGKKLQVRERNLSRVLDEVNIKAICCAKMASQSAKKCVAMAKQAIVQATIVKTSMYARLAADYANAVCLSLDVEFEKQLKRRRTRTTWAFVNASKVALDAAIFAESIVRNISVTNMKRRVQFFEGQERRIHKIERYHHSDINQAAKDHRERMKKDQHKHHHHHRSTRGKKSSKCSGDHARMKKENKTHDAEHEKRREDAQRRRKRAAKEKNRKKKEKSSASAAAAELRLEMARNAIANAVRVSIESVSSAFLAHEHAQQAARSALEHVNRNAVRVAKSSARAANKCAKNARQLVCKMNAIRNASDVAIRAAMSAANVCTDLVGVVREAVSNRRPPQHHHDDIDILDEKQILDEVVHLDPRMVALHREILHQQKDQCARIANTFDTCIAPENQELASALIRWYQEIVRAKEAGELVEKMLMSGTETDDTVSPKIKNLDTQLNESKNTQKKKKKSWKKKKKYQKKKNDGKNSTSSERRSSSVKKNNASSGGEGQQQSKSKRGQRKFNKKKKNTSSSSGA